MTSILTNHAKTHLWQAPNQDYQFNIGLGRLTKDGGFTSHANVMWHQVLSPTRHEGTNKWHHVYQIGQISPLTLNLVNRLELDRWVPAKHLVDDFDLLIEVYFESGSVVPLSHVWLMRDYTDNLLVCVWHDRSLNYGSLHLFDTSHHPITKKVTLDTDKLVTRFYTNSYLKNTQFNAKTKVRMDSIKTHSGIINSGNDYNLFIENVRKITTLFGNVGMGMWYEDGFFVSAPKAYNNTMQGKTYTFVWDETFKFSQTFLLKECPAFTSIKDLNRKKYLLLCDTEYDIIDYFDDIDFYLIRKDESKGTFRGVYINRTKEGMFRQVTHNAYALDAAYLEWYTRHHDFLGDLAECHILIMVRNGGMMRGVFSNSHRIDELFRLPYQTVLNAFLNTDSLIPEWRAATLENSDYTALMGASDIDHCEEVATRAYGYTGLVSSLAYPIVTVKNGRINGVPEVCRIADKTTGDGVSSVFCYDSEGGYLGYYSSSSLQETMTLPKEFSSAAKAEVFALKTVDSSSYCGIVIDQNVSTWDLEQYGFRVYACTYTNDRPSGDWRDITGKPYYTFTKGGDGKLPTIEWNARLMSEAGLIGAVKINKYMLINEVDIPEVIRLNRGNLVYSIKGTVNNRGTSDYNTLSLPFGCVEVFFKDNTLIEGIDYLVKWPMVYILNREVLKDPHTTAKLIIRCYGACNPETMKPYPPVESGFVSKGYLSVDGQYDITKHRPNKVVINSAIVDKGKYKLAEYGEGVLYQPDGRPYCIRDYIVPIEGFSTGNTVDMYRKMVETDKRLGDYLSQFIPEPEIRRPTVFQEPWQLVSPLVLYLLTEIKNGQYDYLKQGGDIDITTVHNVVKPLQWLLEFDPINLGIDERYIAVRPHPYLEPMRCSSRQYEFLELVINLYLKGKVDLTNFVQITE